jgi:hypothetical protein
VRHATSFVLGAALALFAGPQTLSAEDPEYPEHERIAKIFSLASGSRIEISTIAGSVEIDTTSGRTADVEVVRAAPTRRELDCGAIVIEQVGSALKIRSENRCQTIRSSHVVKLSVPRDVNLSLRNIAGHVRIGSTDGMVRLESIAGHVEAEGLRHARMVSLANGLALTVSDLSARGISVISVMGAIDLDVGPHADAEVITRSVTGHIDTEVRGARIMKIDDANRNTVIGSGRGKIEIISVAGTIRIHG